jgi:SAM-dependent methyltransferase
MPTDWDLSADAWISVIGNHGDWGRKYVLDAPMLARVRERGFVDAVDIGCGEGRFCRLLQVEGVRAVGIDPTAALIHRARAVDPTGDYRIEPAHRLSLLDCSVDIAIAYLSLIDIVNLQQAIDEVHRVLRPCGVFLIANLQAFNTAAVPQGWTREPDGSRRFCIDHYLQERPVEVAWRGIRIVNWHRPLSTYMRALLGAGFTLHHFDEPPPSISGDDKSERYRRVPNFFIMEWRKS